MRALVAVGCLLALVAAPIARADDVSERVRAAIEAHVRERAASPPSEIDLPDLGALLADVPGAAEAEVEVRSDPGARMAGAVPLGVRLRRDGRTLRYASVTVRVRVETPMLVAARTLSKGSLVRDEDLREEPRDVSAAPPDRVASAEQVVGRRTTRTIAAGAPWRAGSVEDTPLVLRNSFVRLRYVQGLLKLETRGRAREDGRVGELVRVQNVDSRREVTGRVAPDGAIDVQL